MTWNEAIKETNYVLASSSSNHGHKGSLSTHNMPSQTEDAVSKGHGGTLEVHQLDAPVLNPSPATPVAATRTPTEGKPLCCDQRRGLVILNLVNLILVLCSVTLLSVLTKDETFQNSNPDYPFKTMFSIHGCNVSTGAGSNRTAYLMKVYNIQRPCFLTLARLICYSSCSRWLWHCVEYGVLSTFTRASSWLQLLATWPLALGRCLSLVVAVRPTLSITST